MPRPEKVQAVADIKERIQNARAVFLAEYAGLSVKQQQMLRRELKANGAEFKVVKMTLARRAAAELEIDTLDEHLLGPTGIAIADGDAVAAAKVLKDFAGANDVFNVKGGLLGLEYLSPERISELADIEPRDVLLAKMAGLFAAPMGNVAGLLQAVQRDVVGLVQALFDKRAAAGEVAEAPDEEAAEETEAPEAMVSEEASDAKPADDETDVAGDEPATEPAASGDAEPESDDSTDEPADEPEAAATEAAAEDTAPSDEGDEKDKTEEAEEE